jgi:nucleoid DNA-binding protein
LELQNVIKDLLAKYNYISLPGLGSFVQSYQSAKLSSDGKEFLPPRQILTFDPSRNFNDEVLERLLIENLQLNQKDAEERVKAFVEGVRKGIASKQGITFLNVGTLKQDEKGSIVFQEADEYSKVSSTFGLEPISVSEKTKGKYQQIQKPKPVAPKPLPRKPFGKKGRNIAIASLAAVIFVGLFLSALYVFVPEFRFWEENRNKPLQSSKLQLTERQFENDISFDEEFIEETISDDFEKNANESNDLTRTIETQVDKKKALFYEEAKTLDVNTYYIISGSFVNIENAQAYYRTLEKQGYKPELLEQQGKYRVAMSKYSDRNRALRELERLRREKPTEAVWLLGL